MMLDVICSKRKTIRIAGDDKPVGIVKSQFLKLNSSHIEYVIALHKVSDMVCLENGLSVITPRKPSERSKRTVYPQRKSYREEIRESIDICMEQKPKDMEELIKHLQEMSMLLKK